MVAKDEIFGCAPVTAFESAQNVQNGDHYRHHGQANQDDAVVDARETGWRNIEGPEAVGRHDNGGDECQSRSEKFRGVLR